MAMGRRLRDSVSKAVSKGRAVCGAAEQAQGGWWIAGTRCGKSLTFQVSIRRTSWGSPPSRISSRGKLA